MSEATVAATEQAAPQTEDDLQPKKHNPAPTNPILRLIGKRVTIALRAGGMEITGTLCAYKAGLLNLSDVEIVGPTELLGELFQHRSVKNVPWILIDRTALTHLYPAE
jgi:hypothetical protein